MTTRRALTLDTPAESFFYQHAGYSYDPKIETKRQGRIRCAKDYAKAEAYANAAGWTFAWPGDEGVTADDVNHDEWCKPNCGIMHAVFGCVLVIEGVCRYEHAVWGIVDPDENFMRTMQAEIALEAMPDFSLVGSEGQA